MHKLLIASVLFVCLLSCKSNADVTVPSTLVLVNHAISEELQRELGLTEFEAATAMEIMGADYAVDNDLLRYQLTVVHGN